MENKGVGLAVVCLVALSLLVVTAIPVYAQAYFITVSVVPPTTSLSQGTSTNISIMLTNSTSKVSCARINLTCDPSVVEVIRVVEGDSDFDVFVPNIVDGKVRMVGLQMGVKNLETPIKFANVTIKAIGKPGDCTPLHLEVEMVTLHDTPIEPMINDGLACISVPVPVCNIYGLSVLIGLLAIITVISIREKVRSRRE